MTAALELAGVSPELLEALTAHVVAKLALVPPPPAQPSEGLSMLPASIRRRECERRQRDAARAKRSHEAIAGLSTLPGSVRTREWRRRLAAAEKGPIASSPMYLHGEAYEKHTGVVPNDDARGPLAEGVAAIVDRAEGRKNLELRRLYSEIRKALFEGSKGRIRLPTMWASLKTEKEDARTLLAEYAPGQIRGAALSLGETWKPSKEFPRPTVSLVLWRLQVWRAGSRPTKRADSRRVTGEQLEQRERSRSQRKIPEPQPPRPSTASASTDSAGTPPCIGEPQEAAARPAGSDGCAAGTMLPAPGPLQLAEPSPSSSALAREVLELVNKTAARCRAFRGPP